MSAWEQHQNSCTLLSNPVTFHLLKSCDQEELTAAFVEQTGAKGKMDDRSLRLSAVCHVRALAVRDDPAWGPGYGGWETEMRPAGVEIITSSRGITTTISSMSILVYHLTFLSSSSSWSSYRGAIWIWSCFLFAAALLNLIRRSPNQIPVAMVLTFAHSISLYHSSAFAGRFRQTGCNTC